MIPIIFTAFENENDRDKILSIYNEYRGLMFYIAKQILSEQAMAEDAVSDSIEKLIRNIHKVGDISCYKTRSLIVIIVRNTALNILKKAKRSDMWDPQAEEAADGSPIAVEKIVSAEAYNNLIEIINSLPDTYRDTAILSLLHEHSHEEIAELLGISYDAVKMRLSRAKKIIRNKLGGEGNA